MIPHQKETQGTVRRARGITKLAGLALICLTSGCAVLEDHIAFSNDAPVGAVQEIFVSTGRLPSATDVDIKQDRSAAVKFAKYEVSIPPTHVLGQIEWPKGVVDPRSDFAVTGVEDLRSSARMIAAIEAQKGDEVVVFLHGYNNTPSEALYRFAQIGHDFRIEEPRVLFAWPSAGTATGYVYDRDSVLFSRDPLAQLLTAISQHTDKKITLIAHSMGGHLAMEVMRQLSLTGQRSVLRDIGTVVLLAPDIDPDIFRAQAHAIGRLPDPFIIMSSKEDRALNFSAILNIGRHKVGDLSQAEDVAGLNVTLFDFTALSDGSNLDHLVPMTSPAAIMVLRDLISFGQLAEPDLSAFDIGDDGVISAKPPVIPANAYSSLSP